MDKGNEMTLTRENTVFWNDRRHCETFGKAWVVREGDTELGVYRLKTDAESRIEEIKLLR